MTKACSQHARKVTGDAMIAQPASGCLVLLFAFRALITGLSYTPAGARYSIRRSSLIWICMPEIHRFALVPHSPAQMFGLVRDVHRYPEFLPWVQGAEVHENAETVQVATLDVKVAGLSRRFTTRNALVPNESLAMELERGPFDELSGRWEFRPLGGDGTRVSLDLSFHLPGSMLMLPFQRGFGRVADRMVDDFCRRADLIHG